MKSPWTILGRAIFWLTWPLFWVYLPTSERTRVLIMHAGKVLVVKGWLGSGKWGLPGGGLHRGEKPLDGAVREVEEETGIRLTNAQLTSLLSGEHREIGLHYYCHYFTATLSALPTTRKQPLEINELEWLDVNMLSKNNVSVDVLTALNGYDKI